MIRTIIIVLFVLIYLILGIPVLLVETVIGKFNRRAKDYSCLRLVQAAFKLIMFATGVKLTVIGEENVPKDRAVLYVGNHRSYFDVVMTYARCPRLTGYVAKVEMLRYPLLRDWMKALYCLFLDRKDIKEGLKTILTAIDEIKKGVSICIFPEGTRNKHDSELEMLPFHEGSFKIATKTNCPVIPIAIHNSAEIFEAHLPKIRPCRVVVEYGEPIYPEQLSKDEKKHLGSYTRNVILEMLKKNQHL